MSYLVLFLVSLLSGCLIFVPSLREKNTIRPILSFSGSFLLSICLLHILPELFSEIDSGSINLGAYLMFGFFLQLILDYFSGGIEHGHAHVNHEKIGHFPFLVFISLCMHAFLEAIPVEHFNNDTHNHPLLIGLIVHKAPISFILAYLLWSYKLSKVWIVLGILIFSFAAPAGVLIGKELVLNPELFDKLMAISAGIILHLSTTILLESSEEHKIKWQKLVPMLLGAGLALLSLL